MKQNAFDLMLSRLEFTSG